MSNVNPAAVGNYTVHGNLTFYSPGPQEGYLRGLRPMFPCVTLCPLIISPKTVKNPALKGLK